MNRALLLLAAALPAACSSAPAPGPAAPAAPEPTASAPAELLPPVGTDPGLRPPSFRFPSLGGGAALSLEEALAAQKGRPLVLVIGVASCSVTTRQMEDLAGAPGPGADGPACLAVVSGTPEEVAEAVPSGNSFPVLVDAAGGVLDLYRVVSTPSVVVLDGKGLIAYIGEGGYIPISQVEGMVSSASKGEPIDATKIQPEGG